MSPSEFRQRYPWKHGEVAAMKDVYILRRWMGANLAPGDTAYTDEECIDLLTENNEWDEKPDILDFMEYMKTLGWFGKVRY